jgi:uncharacterized membrane protein
MLEFVLIILFETIGKNPLLLRVGLDFLALGCYS